ncbi:MAG: DUF1294 domain-containing protein [Candidatus Omnitrophica bacterium]|nr:DUF1294 domain-containing protein [Candidatus Omnitrophota bacterium]
MSYFFIYLIIINGFVFLLYGYDKWLARRKGKRIAEKTLHQWTLLGGSLGAFLAQKIFRHKTLKKSFQRTYWLIVILQLIIVIVLVKISIR